MRARQTTPRFGTGSARARAPRIPSPPAPVASRLAGASPVGVAPTYLSARRVPSFSRCAMLSSRCCAAAALALASSLAALVVACAAASSGAEPTTTPATVSSPAAAGGSAATANCTRCGGATMQSRAVRLQAIKAQILSKLGMKRAPNVTRRALPGIPPLHRLLDRYDAGMMQADAPFEPGEQYDDDDDFHMAAEKIITFGQHGEPVRCFSSYFVVVFPPSRVSNFLQAAFHAATAISNYILSFGMKTFFFFFTFLNCAARFGPVVNLTHIQAPQLCAKYAPLLGYFVHIPTNVCRYFINWQRC